MSDEQRLLYVPSAFERERLGEGFRFVLSDSPWDGSVNLFVRACDREQRVVILGRMLWERKELGTLAPPTIDLTRKELQQLLDEVWRLGFRPSKRGEPEVAVLDATQKHLDDMRALVSHTLKAKLP